MCDYNIGDVMKNNISYSGIRNVQLSCSFQCSSCKDGLTIDFAATTYVLDCAIKRSECYIGEQMFTHTSYLHVTCSK
jgi:hypothetical protein